ncbi:Uncharacterised protein [Vibrio cholerae]|nr:Uncharacterised protein [Vibrio cholerae]
MRCGHNYCAGHRNLLREGELDIPRARRHIDHQIIQIRPLGFIE